MVEHVGKVYLVGSGPGDAAYLTLQAQAVLAQAEVLVYDALVDGDLINLVPDTCLKLDVGKRGGQPSTPQSEINRLIVEHCQQGKIVVRLKNGDPFIFGRVQSEIGALKQNNCEFEIIPGLSSALVAPLMAGIPLTDPKLSQSFTVVTAHNPDSLNWVSLTKLDTLVFLMGGRTLPEIVRRLRGHGRSPSTPIAVIRYAGRANQRIWDGTLHTILDKTAGESLSPCVIVVGEVVRLRAYIGAQGRMAIGEVHEPQKTAGRREEVEAERRGRIEERRGSENPGTRIEAAEFRLPRAPEPSRQESSPTPDLQPPTPDLQPPTPDPQPLTPDPLPLEAKTILVTRAASQSSQFTDLLQEQGARVIEMPTLEIGPPSSWRDLDRAIDRIDDFDWLILTSTNGVDYFFQRLEEVTGERAFYSNIKIAVVGEKTAQRLLKMGLQPDFVPPNFVADALVTNFPEPLAGLRVLFPRVESGGREVLVKEFTNQGAKVREVAAYESRCPDAIAPAALKALQTGRVDVVTFASSKTVQHFCQLLQQVSDDWQQWLDGVAVASIGPQTSNSCAELLGRVDVEAQEYTLDGLTQAIVAWATPQPETESSAVVEELASEENSTPKDSEDLELVSEANTEAAISEERQDSISDEGLIDVEVVAVGEEIAQLETLQVELDSTSPTMYESVNDSEVLMAEAELLAEIQATIEQGEHPDPQIDPRLSDS